MADTNQAPLLQSKTSKDQGSGLQEQKVVVNLRDQRSLKGILQILDYQEKYIQIRIKGKNKAQSVTELGFEDIHSIYFVYDLSKKLPRIRMDSASWDKIFQDRISGTMSFQWIQEKWNLHFQQSEKDFGGVFLEPRESSANVLKVFFPFPKIKSISGSEKLGERLLSEGFISQDELEAGLHKQSELRQERIGDILLEQGQVKPDTLRHALNKQKSRFDARLGEILVAAGAVTEKQVGEALKRQKKQSTRRLGQILIDMGVITAEMLALSMALKFGLSYVNIKDYPVDAAALDCVPMDMARRLKIFPIMLKDEELTVAFSDPTNLDQKQDLAFHTEKQIKEIIATEEGILDAIEEHYGKDPDSNLDQLLADEAEIEEVSENREVEYELSEKTGREKPIIELVNHIIKTAVKKKASDLHIVPEGRRVKVELRIDGTLREELALGSERLPSVIARMKIMGNMNIAERRLPQDGRSKVKVGSKVVDLRFSCMPSVFGESMVVRLLDKESGVVDLDQIGFLEKELREIRVSQRKAYGMILVTGPTGSGKSSTIYACLQEEAFHNKNIVTLEDPVEYELPGITQVQIKENIGLTFAKGLRQILRHDPDVIIVGEIRDGETARIAIQSALTGHLLFSTLHTNTAPESFLRLNEMGVEPYLVSSSILGVISQRLVKKLCPACKTPDPHALQKLESSHYPARPSSHTTEFFMAQGCEQCNQTGYKGRTVVYEYLIPNEDIKRAAIQNRSAGEIRLMAQKKGMRTMEQVALLKAEQGLTSVDEIIPLMSTIDQEESVAAE